LASLTSEAAARILTCRFRTGTIPTPPPGQCRDNGPTSSTWTRGTPTRCFRSAQFGHPSHGPTRIIMPCRRADKRYSNGLTFNASFNLQKAMYIFTVPLTRAGPLYLTRAGTLYQDGVLPDGRRARSRYDRDPAARAVRDSYADTSNRLLQVTMEYAGTDCSYFPAPMAGGTGPAFHRVCPLRLTAGI